MEQAHHESYPAQSPRLSPGLPSSFCLLLSGQRAYKEEEIMMEVKRVNEWGGGVYISGQTRAALLAISSCFFSARVCKYVQCMPIPQSLNHICFHTLKWHNFSIGALFSHLHASMRMWHNALKSYFLSVSFRSRNKFCQYSRVGKVPD